MLVNKCVLRYMGNQDWWGNLLCWNINGRSLPAHVTKHCTWLVCMIYPTCMANGFGQQIIGYDCLVEWTPRSTDFSLLDIPRTLWGYIKAQACVTEPTSLVDLKQRIILACRTVTSAMMQRIPDFVLSRIQLCIATNWEHFERYF